MKHAAERTSEPTSARLAVARRVGAAVAPLALLAGCAQTPSVTAEAATQPEAQHVAAAAEISAVLSKGEVAHNVLIARNGTTTLSQPAADGRTVVLEPLVFDDNTYGYVTADPRTSAMTVELFDSPAGILPVTAIDPTVDVQPVEPTIDSVDLVPMWGIDFTLNESGASGGAISVSGAVVNGELGQPYSQAMETAGVLLETQEAVR